MKVYLISSGDSDYYSVHAIFSTKELAQEYINTSGTPNYYYEIEEWELDPKTWFQKTGLHLFRVVAYNNENKETYVHLIYDNEKPTGIQLENFEMGYNKTKRLIGNILAKDQQDALRVVDEKRAELINNNMW
jgi:hypothetical protein